VFLLALLMGGVLCAGSLQDGIACLNEGKKAEAVPLLKQAFRDDPTSVDACVYLGQAAAATGDHELAIAMFENALQLNPDMPPVRLDLAQSYYALGLFDMAEKEFQTVLDGDVPDGKVRQNIEGFLAAIREKRQKAGHVFLQSYMVRLELARDSNVLASPTGSVELDIYIPGLDGGLDVPVERDGYLAFWGSGNFEFRKAESMLGWQAAVDLGNVSYFDHKDQDLQILGARLGPALRLSENGAAGLMAKGIYMDKDYQSYLRSWGALAWTSWRLPGNAAVRAEAELMDRDFTQPVDDGSDGTYGAVRLAPSVLVGRSLFSGTIGYEYANTDDASESYDRLALGLQATRVLLPRWQIHGTLSAVYRESLYDSPGAYSSSRRRDREQVYGAAIERVFRTTWLREETWRVGVFYEYSKSTSNLDLYDYDRHLSGLRATVVF
jgi:tetratricopeptide (TPR) repeat protein